MKGKFYLFVFLALVGCDGNSTYETQNRAIPIRLEEAKESNLSELYEGIEYVLLKKADQFPLIRPYKFKIHGNLLGIEDKGAEQYVFFDLNGNPQFKIVANGGGGPGEFRRTEDFQISDEGIIIKDPMLSKFLFYDLAGNFIKEEKSKVRTSYFFKTDDFELHYSKNIREHGDYEFYSIEDDKILGLVPTISPIKDVVYSNKNSFILDAKRNDLIFNIPYSNKVAFFNVSGDLEKILEFDFGDKYLTEEDQAKLRPEEMNDLIMRQNLVSGIGSFFPMENGYLLTFGSGYRYNHQVFLNLGFSVMGHFNKINNDIDRMPVKTVPWFFHEDRLGFYIPSSEFLADYLDKFEIGTENVINSNLHQFVEKHQNELGDDSYVLTFLKLKKEAFSD